MSDLDEKKFMQLVNDSFNKTKLQGRPVFTNFYNKDWAIAVLQKNHKAGIINNCYFFGGYEGAERQVLGVSEYPIEDYEFPISGIKLKVNVGKNKPLTHRDYLGAIINLGIKREIIGDIMLNDEGADIVLKENMSDYISQELTSVSKYNEIEILQVDVSEIKISIPNTKECHVVVASLRMDVIVAAGFGLSRGESVKLIESSKVKCNGMDVTCKQKVKQGDSISARGYGKVKFGQIKALTKKERLQVTIEKYI